LHRVAENQVDELPVCEHVRRYTREAFALAEDPVLADRRLAATAHALGYRGHCLTKSRRYAATMVSLIACQGLRSPEELLAIEVRHVRVRTLLVEQRNTDGQIVAGQKVRGFHPRAST
jgi:hypothetical protein